jgi:hypothetical protein
MGEIGALRSVLFERPQIKKPFRVTSVVWMINLILKRILKAWGVKLCDGLKWLRRETNGGIL